MARTQGTSARTQRLIAGVATVLVAAAGAIALGRVFEGGGAARMRLLAAGVASAVVACAAGTAQPGARHGREHRGPRSIVDRVAVFPETTWYRPAHARHAAGRSLDAAAAGRRAGPGAGGAPPPLAPLMLAAVPAVWAAVFAPTRSRSAPGAPCSRCCRPSRWSASPTRCSRTCSARSSACSSSGGHGAPVRRRAPARAGLGAGVDRPGARGRPRPGGRARGSRGWRRPRSWSRRSPPSCCPGSARAGP